MQPDHLLFHEKYRIPSARASWWDYKSAGAYFVTICTHEKRRCLGALTNGQNALSPAGEIAAANWLRLPDVFPHARLGSFIVTPNHLHGILMLTETVSEHLSELLPEGLKGGITGAHNPMLNKGVSHMIRWFKGLTTHEIRKIDFTFRWQSRFYDRIIRDEKEYQAIAAYIRTNPARWSP